MKQNETGMSRRDFMKGVGVALGGVAAATTLGVYATNPETAAAETTAEMQARVGMPESAKPIPPVAPPAQWDFEADVVVCGAGMSGLMSACKAKDTGASVIALEKNAIPGGDGQWAEATVSNIPEMPAFHNFLRIDEGMLTPMGGKNHRLQFKMWSRWPAMLDYLQGDIGVLLTLNPDALGGRAAVGSYSEYYNEGFLGQGVVVPAVPVSPEYPDDIHRWHPHEARGYTNAMYRYALKQGVDIKLSTPLTTLVTDGGRVVGVKAKDNKNGGKDIFVKAKTVILATGGIVANRPMIEYYTPPEKLRFISKYAGMNSATGDGHRVAQGVGGFLEEMANFDIWDGGVDDPSYVNGPRAVYTAANQLARQKSLSVNLLGKRFTDEARYSGNCYTYNGYQKSYQLDSTSFTLFDANCISEEDIIAKFEPLACEYPTPWFKQDFERQLKAGIIMKADTIEALAGMMGVDAAALKATVDRYNSLCDKGEDTDMAKNPKYLIPIKTAPFYAIKEVGGIYWHHGGGVVYNESLQVVNERYLPIPGLYVAGENGRTLCQVANALGSGYLAGENAAREAQGKPVEF